MQLSLEDQSVQNIYQDGYNCQVLVWRHSDDALSTLNIAMGVVGAFIIIEPPYQLAHRDLPN